MTLTDDDLRRMALGRTETLPAPPRPFPEISARAGRIRRTRSAAIGAATAGALGAAALVVAVAVNGLPGAGSPRVAAPGAGISPTVAAPTTPAQQAGTDCSTGYAASGTFEQVPGLLHLPPADVAVDPLVLSFVRDDTSACTPPRTAALWYGTSGGTVTARMQVDGPDARDPYDHPGGSFGGSISTETVGDRTVRVYDFGSDWPFPETAYYWTEPDGSTWWADIRGLDGAAARAAIAGLRVDGGLLDPASRPDVLTEGVVGDGGPAPRHQRYFYAAYKNENEDAGGWSVEIGDGSSDVGWQGLLGSRKVDVNGRPGWLTPNKGLADLTWQGADGNLYHVHGTISETKALAVARSLVPVAPDDPRLVASQETPVPTEEQTNTSTGTPTSTSTT